jgi:hypothetical protein
VLDGTAPIATTDQASYTPAGLEFGCTNYWKVDEVNQTDAIAVWEGDLWRFSTAAYTVIDDMEGYDDEENRIFDTWLDGYVNDTGSTVGYFEAPFAEQSVVNSGGQSMPLEYTNDAAPFYSEAERVFETPQDWTRNGIRALTLHFYGGPDSAPSGSDRLYVAIEDTAGRVGTVRYDPTDGALTQAWWHEWNVDLGTVGQSGVDLTQVARVCLGIGDRANPQPGGSGLLFVDDIRLHPRRCVSSMRAPEADLNGDCRVDFLDLELVAGDWLAMDRMLPVPASPPDDAALVAHFTLDGDVTDNSGNNLNGTISGGPVYAEGIAGGALQFDGSDDYVDCTNNVAFDVIDDTITVAAWIKVYTFDKNYQTIVAKGDSSWRLSRNQTTDNIHWRCNGPSPALRVNGQVNVNDGRWHHVAGTYDGTTARLYVDGIADGLVATSGPIARNTERVYIGENPEAPGRQWSGLIDDVRVYSRALSEDEIRYLADATPGDGSLYVPLASPAELHEAEALGSRSINLKDFSALAAQWLQEESWP